MTTTRPPAPPPMPAQPATAALPVEAATHFMNSRLVKVMISSLAGGRRRRCVAGLHGGKVTRDEFELLVAVALRVLVHDRRRALAVPEILHRLLELGLVAAGQAGRHAPNAAAVVAVAGKARGSEAARGTPVLRLGGGTGREQRSEAAG